MDPKKEKEKSKEETLVIYPTEQDDLRIASDDMEEEYKTE
jgi:hypothetical protein